MSITKRNAIGDDLALLAFLQAFAHGLAGLLSGLCAGGDIGTGGGMSDAIIAGIGVADVADADGAAFGFVVCQQAGPAPDPAPPAGGG